MTVTELESLRTLVRRFLGEHNTNCGEHARKVDYSVRLAIANHSSNKTGTT